MYSEEHVDRLGLVWYGFVGKKYYQVRRSPVLGLVSYYWVEFRGCKLLKKKYLRRFW